jgi:bifunctional DNA-binding transcriptional regulator/antitoxin component of YhaV-PrlF toxin-antitoxin module
VDHFLIVQGSLPISVGAPHHGTRPNVDADLATGPIALALAGQLKGRAVVVSDLRRRVDVNKNPVHINWRERKYAIRYQDEMFRGLPRLLIEIHGHVSGHYPIEITSGFDLDQTSPGDAMFLERLRRFKEFLMTQLPGKIGQTVGVGVYPLDRDVRKAATNTYTFQKVRRARNRVGVEWYGLNIELSADLRTGERASSSEFVHALAEAFASSIHFAFEPLPEPGVFIPTHADPADDGQVFGKSMRVMKGPADTIWKNIALLNPKDIISLGYLDGDLVSLINHCEQMRVPVSSSLLIPLNRIAIPERLRRQLELKPGDSVKLMRPGSTNGTVSSRRSQTVVIADVRSDKAMQIWAHPLTLQGLQAEPVSIFSAAGPFQITSPVPVKINHAENPLERFVIASDSLMKRLTLSIGDVLKIELPE